MTRCVHQHPDLEGHRAALRSVFGTLSEDFSQTMFGKLAAALRPNPFEQLDEATLNAAIALIASMQPETELEAMLAVQIAATGFAGQKLLRQSQHHLDEIHISVYGNYAVKLLRLQLEMIQTLDRHRRGNTQRWRFNTSISIPEPRGWSELSTLQKMSEQGDGEK